ncbi:LytTR family DNA-binding domain-containing protein [Flagellimonas maritima]|nr:LytTR family DNA-binding domain-containing protein [Allomuricauda aurantiaca]
MVLLIFQPFDIKHGFTFTGIVRVLTYSIMTSIVYLSFDLWAAPILKKRKWNPFYVTLWYSIVFICISISIFFIKNLWLKFTVYTLNDYWTVLGKVSLITFALISIFILIYRLNLFKDKPSQIKLKSADTNPKYLQVQRNQILALSQEKNYTTIFYLSDNKFKKILLRGSLSHFQTQLSREMVRINRSYIINLDYVINLNLNAQGGVIKMKYFDGHLKLSKKFVKNIDEIVK